MKISSLLLGIVSFGVSLVLNAQADSKWFVSSETTLLRSPAKGYIAIDHKIDVKLATGACEDADNSLRLHVNFDPADSTKGSYIKMSAIKDKYILAVSYLNGVEICEDGFCFNSSIRKPYWEHEVDREDPTKPIVYLHVKSLLAVQNQEGFMGKFCYQLNPLIRSRFALDHPMLDKELKSAGKLLLQTKYFLVDKVNRSFQVISQNVVDLSDFRSWGSPQKTSVVNASNRVIGEMVISNSK